VSSRKAPSEPPKSTIDPVAGSNVIAAPSRAGGDEADCSCCQPAASHDQVCAMSAPSEYPPNRRVVPVAASNAIDDP
jgi:hypothetical protein